MSSLNRSISMCELLAKFDIDAPDIMVDELVLDSREVAVHTAFVAVIGHQRDGRDFIPQAISLGARIILAETTEALEHGRLSMREQTVIIAFYQLNSRLSELAAAFYQYPAEHMQVIAVTGTNGKTSTVNLIAQLGQMGGCQSASVGTLGVQRCAQAARQSWSTEAVNTTPDAIKLQRNMAQLSQQGVALVALEASSHALVQGRLAALKTDAAVFTNLTRDHLDYHGDMTAYAEAKRLLLSQPGLKTLIVNFDDPESANWLKVAPSQLDITACSVGNTDVKSSGKKFCLATEIEYTTAGCKFLLISSWGSISISTPLLGQFNIANVLAALACHLSAGVELEVLARYCRELVPVPGRMQVFSNSTGANVVVDYAHTPDALAQTLQALRMHCRQQLWCVFGCGGDRDPGKRPLMGEIAEQGADQVVLTNDNSRTESPNKIIKNILSGCQHPEQIHVQLNRKRAIQWALMRAKQDDLVLVAGKGHENYQIIGEQRLQYDERAYVEKLLRGLGA